MTLKLNRAAFNHAKQLIHDGKLVIDEKGEWSDHQPSAKTENAYLRIRGFHEYSKWYLGIDDQQDEQTKRRYKFPYSDFAKVHRCGILSAESRAGQYKYLDIETAAAHLHGMIDGSRSQAAD